MRIKTTPTKSRKRTPIKSINFGGSVVSEGNFSNKPSNPFSNAPSAIGINIAPVGRTAASHAPTFRAIKEEVPQLAHFYDEILTIEQLLDLDIMMPPSYPPSAIDGGPRAASGFTSMNVTPSKADYTKSTFEDFTDFGSYLNKRDAQRV